MEKRSIFLIVFSIIGVIAISLIDSLSKNELLEWIVIIVYLLVIFITMYLPNKKNKKKKSRL